MILVAEPFYNEAGYEARRHEPDTITRSQRYSEGAAVNAFEYMFEVSKWRGWRRRRCSDIQQATSGIRQFD